VKLDLELLQRGLSESPAFMSAQHYRRAWNRIDSFRTLTELVDALR
jgi:hypothetical protein